MTEKVLGKLLDTLEVQLHAFAVLRIDKGYRLSIDPTDAVVIHYVLNGIGVLQVGDGAPVAFAPHNILLVPARQRQSLSTTSENPLTVPASECSTLLADGLLGFKAGPTGDEILVVCGLISATYRGAFGLFDQLSVPLVETVAEIPHLRDVFGNLFDELANPGIGSRALTEALMKQCLIFVLRRHFVERGSDSPLFGVLKDQRLARAITAVIERPAARQSVDDLAAIAGMSRSSFSQHFSDTFAETPAEFVMRVRLHHAAHLLATTDLPIKTVAAIIGYDSRSHFTHAFRKAYAVDPKSYRSVKAFSQGISV